MFSVTPLLDQINPLLPQIITWLLTYSLHSSLILFVIWLFTRLNRNRDPHVHDTLWKIAIFGGIITTSLQLFSGMEPIAGHHQLGGREQSLPEHLTSRLAADSLDIPFTVNTHPNERSIVRKNLKSVFILVDSDHPPHHSLTSDFNFDSGDQRASYTMSSSGLSHQTTASPNNRNMEITVQSRMR